MSIHQRGSRNGRAKLTEADVVDIRRKLRLGVRQSEIAAQYGVSFRAISSIKTGIRWTHVKDEPEAGRISHRGVTLPALPF